MPRSIADILRSLTVFFVKTNCRMMWAKPSVADPVDVVDPADRVELLFHAVDTSRSTVRRCARIGHDTMTIG